MDFSQNITSFDRLPPGNWRASKQNVHENRALQAFLCQTGFAVNDWMTQWQRWETVCPYFAGYRTAAALLLHQFKGY